MEVGENQTNSQAVLPPLFLAKSRWVLGTGGACLPCPASVRTLLPSDAEGSQAAKGNTEGDETTVRIRGCIKWLARQKDKKERNERRCPIYGT